MEINEVDDLEMCVQKTTAKELPPDKRIDPRSKSLSECGCCDGYNINCPAYVPLQQDYKVKNHER